MRFRTWALALVLSVGVTGLVQASPKKTTVSHPKSHKPKKAKKTKSAKHMKTAKASKARKAKPARHAKG